MAKGKVNYQIPQKGSVAKITAIIVAVILVISGVLTAINYGSHGFTDWNVRSWFNSWGQGQNRPGHHGCRCVHQPDPLQGP